MEAVQNVTINKNELRVSLSPQTYELRNETTDSEYRSSHHKEVPNKR